MSNNKVTPLGKKTIGTIEYFGIQSGRNFLIVKKDSTTSSSVTFGYAFYKTSAAFNAAFASPAGVTYNANADQYINEGNYI